MKMNTRILNQNNQNVCGIYCRLSKDDDNLGESQSIQYQKQVLLKYAQDNNWIIYDIYIDDGYSGTNFDRPGFNQMIEDVEKRRISIILTKDLSRIGRNYLKTGYFTEEYFPKNNIRFIAVNDNFDTKFDENNELVPFKNIINEWYARDVSKKIRFTFTNMQKSGVERKTAIPLYGYLFDENGKRHLDIETAPIVRYIFKRYLECQSSTTIAKELTQEKIYTPGYYSYYKNGYCRDKYFDYPEEKKTSWEKRMVYRILRKKEYLGYLILGKTKTTFKNKKNQQVPESLRSIHKNRFEAIIDEDTYNRVQSFLNSHVEKSKSSEENIFLGIVYCGVCGNKLRYGKHDKYGYRYSCRQKEGLTSGAIKASELKTIVENDIINLRNIIIEKKELFLNYSQSIILSEINLDPKKEMQLAKINALRDKEEKLKKYLRHLFEQHSSGILHKEIYEDLLNSYSKELKEVNFELQNFQLDQNINESVEKIEFVKRFVERVENLDITSIINRRLINMLIEKIIIKCGDKILKHRKRAIYVTIIYKKINNLIEGFKESNE